MNQDSNKFKVFDKHPYSNCFSGEDELKLMPDMFLNGKTGRLGHSTQNVYLSDGKTERYIVCKSIGKRDKNNVLIFDGDIVRFKEYLSEDTYLIGVVEWEPDSCVYRITHKDDIWGSDHQFFGYKVKPDNIEVIGHKLTHPELVQKMHELKK